MGLVAVMLLASVVPAVGRVQTSSVPPVQMGSARGVPEEAYEGPYGEKLLFLEHSIRCSCGCNLDVHTCQLQMQCGTSPEWSKRILRELEEGKTEEVILAGFVSDFGRSVLMAPPAEGFTWVGYLLPATTIVIGAMAIGLLLRRQVGRAGSALASAGVASEDWERIASELRELERDESD